jgi:1-acyl-sn-glycerol-3-phosphate acyltransferase
MNSKSVSIPHDGLITRIRKCCTLISSAVFLVSAMFFSNCLQLLTSPLIFISRPLVYALNSYFAGSLWLICQHMLEQQNGVRIEVSGMENVPENESALVISNHCSFLDFCMVHSVSMRCKMIGNCRYFSKDSIKYMPFFGWGMYFAGFIFLKRNWAQDQKHINSTFETLVKNRLPVHLISYLEGTRVNPKKLKESHEYAAKNNLPLLEYTLLPRSKGFAASVKGLRNSHINHVYDLTIAYYHYKRGFGSTPSLSDYLLGRINEYQLKVHVDRYSMDEVPETDSEISQWLVSLYEKKNIRLSQWKTNWDSQWKNTIKAE